MKIRDVLLLGAVTLSSLFLGCRNSEMNEFLDAHKFDGNLNGQSVHFGSDFRTGVLRIGTRPNIRHPNYVQFWDRGFDGTVDRYTVRRPDQARRDYSANNPEDTEHLEAATTKYQAWLGAIVEERQRMRDQDLVDLQNFIPQNN